MSSVRREGRAGEGTGAWLLDDDAARGMTTLGLNFEAQGRKIRVGDAQPVRRRGGITTGRSGGHDPLGGLADRAPGHRRCRQPVRRALRPRLTSR